MKGQTTYFRSLAQLDISEEFQEMLQKVLQAKDSGAAELQKQRQAAGPN